MSSESHIFESIAGLRYTRDYISSERERGLIESIDALPWDTVRRGGRAQCYGPVFDFKAGTVSDLSRVVPLPGFIKELADELQHGGHFETSPECIIVNEYLPGQQLPPHIDVTEYWGPKVATLSLLSPIEMTLINDKNPKERTKILLHPSSLLTLEGAARYEWKHGIKGKTTDLVDGKITRRRRRVSISFRNIRRECFSAEALKIIDHRS